MTNLCGSSQCQLNVMRRKGMLSPSICLDMGHGSFLGILPRLTFRLIIRHKDGFYMHVFTCMCVYVCLEYSFCESCLQKNSWYGWDIPWFPFKNFPEALLLLILCVTIFFYLLLRIDCPPKSIYWNLVLR